MSRRLIVRTVGAALSLILPALAIAFWADAVWPLVLFAAWTVAAASAVVASEQRDARRGREHAIEAMRNLTIDTLKHHRHDWMNEIQILYGYLKLNKPDKAIEVVERIKRHMANDSRMSRLGTSKLITYLLSFRTTCNTMKLEVEIEEDFDLTGGPDRSAFADAVIGLVDAVREQSKLSAAGEENVLQLFFRSTESDILLEMKYNGMIAARDSLSFGLERALKGVGRLSEEDRLPDSEPAGASRRMIVAFPLKEQAG
jgi:hypothetical protein